MQSTSQYLVPVHHVTEKQKVQGEFEVRAKVRKAHDLGSMDVFGDQLGVNNNEFQMLTFFLHRELVEELHPLMKEALERRPEVRFLI